MFAIQAITLACNLALSPVELSTVPEGLLSPAEALARLDARDYPSAVDALRHHVLAGDPTAQAALGLLYAHGQGVDQDLVVAVDWMEKAAGGNERWRELRDHLVIALELERQSRRRVADRLQLRQPWPDPYQRLGYRQRFSSRTDRVAFRRPNN